MNKKEFCKNCQKKTKIYDLKYLFANAKTLNDWKWFLRLETHHLRKKEFQVLICKRCEKNSKQIKKRKCKINFKNFLKNKGEIKC